MIEALERRTHRFYSGRQISRKQPCTPVFRRFLRDLRSLNVPFLFLLLEHRSLLRLTGSGWDSGRGGFRFKCFPAYYRLFMSVSLHKNDGLHEVVLPMRRVLFSILLFLVFQHNVAAKEESVVDESLNPQLLHPVQVFCLHPIFHRVPRNSLLKRRS